MKQFEYQTRAIDELTSKVISCSTKAASAKR